VGLRAVKLSLWIGVPVLLLVLWAWYASYYSTVLVWELRKLIPWAVALLVLAAGVVLVAAPTAVLKRLRRDYPWYGTTIWLAGAGLVVGVAAAVLWLLWASYQSDRVYAASATVVTDPMPEVAPRAPYLVGKAQAGPGLGEVSGEITDVSYLADSDRFATLVQRRGWLAGYEVGFTQEIPLQGRGRNARKCDFDTARATARVGGWFGHNLGRKISSQLRGARFKDRDVYVYCDGDTPVVVVPLKRQTGVVIVTERPAGVALYNGRTGRITITTDTSGIPGPSYPLSLAARQRAGSHGLHGFSDWVFNRAGWDASEDGANTGNESEFTLNRADGSGPVFLTPLTPRGSATSIVAVSTVPARRAGTGLAPLTVYRLSPSWASPAAIVSRIKDDYRDVCCYNDTRVFEVLPTGGDRWVATIGSEQNLRYRVEGNGPLTGDKATCLKTAEGQLLRCGPQGPGAPGSQPGQPGPEHPGQQPPPQVQQPCDPNDLSKCSNEALAELQRRVADEVARRLTGR
jgi:hypothetical protein